MQTAKTYNCDVCGSDQSRSIEIAKKYTNDQPLDVCGKCGFVYIRNRRSALDIAKSWSEDIFQKGYTAKIPYVLARQTYVADLVDVSIGLKGKKICDIGAGEGQFLSICKRQHPNVEVFGIEPSAHNVGLLKQQNIKCFQGTIEEFKDSQTFTPNTFDIVTIMWTLENCLNCKEMLECAWDMLKEGGQVVVATGSRILVPFKKPLNDYLSSNPADTHCFRFSANSLQNLLKVSGFAIKHVNRYYDGDFLIVIGEKTNEKSKSLKLEKDDAETVIEFFNRWDQETNWLKSKNLIN